MTKTGIGAMITSCRSRPTRT